MSTMVKRAWHFQNGKRKKMNQKIPWRIHGTNGIFTYMKVDLYGKCQYTSPTDAMGMIALPSPKSFAVLHYSTKKWNSRATQNFTPFCWKKALGGIESQNHQKQTSHSIQCKTPSTWSFWWALDSWNLSWNLSTPVILRILGFLNAPHLVGKYMIPGDPSSLPQDQRVA